jgi:alpha-amylase
MVAALFIAAGMSLTASPSVAENLLISPAPSVEAVAPGSVGIQMFMYNWNSVASECTASLGPAGIKWVLVMPPQEHINGLAWWVHYQPASYAIDSRLGTRAEFAAMTAACNAAGVKVIADAVINHMSSSAVGVGWGGTSYTKYDYPGLYAESDFHACRTGIDWNDSASVQTCELLGLADLDTSSTSVQGKIVSYLRDLVSLGVSGFRIDAAKHIAVSELAAIRSQLPAGATFIHEV